MPRTVPEPFRIKMVEPIYLRSREERERLLAEADYNVFRIRGEDVFIDLPTDNGASTMSDRQWSAMLRADESYASPRSYFTLAEAVQRIFGFEHVAWAHQGRAAENILFSVAVKPGDTVPANAHFQTTRWNIEAAGGTAVDLLVGEGYDTTSEAPFKGNMDLDKLQDLIRRVGADKIPLVVQTLTNNNNGGQPVSLENLRRTKETLRPFGIPLFLDAARYAENAYLIKERESAYADRGIREIVTELFALADGFFMSAKKDGLVNMGALLAVRDAKLFERITRQMNVREGFLTHAGLTGRDMEALAIGLEEALDERYLAYRVGQVRYLADQLIAVGIPVVRPTGGHAIHLDAARFLPHLSPAELPSEALTVQLYLEGGIRATPLAFGVVTQKGTSADERGSPLCLLRLAIPRRVYTQTHLDYVAEVIIDVFRRRHEVRGMQLLSISKALPLWTARYQRLGE